MVHLTVNTGVGLPTPDFTCLLPDYSSCSGFPLACVHIRGCDVAEGEAAAQLSNILQWSRCPGCPLSQPQDRTASSDTSSEGLQTSEVSAETHSETPRLLQCSVVSALQPKGKHCWNPCNGDPSQCPHTPGHVILAQESEGVARHESSTQSYPGGGRQLWAQHGFP